MRKIKIVFYSIIVSLWGAAIAWGQDAPGAPPVVDTQPAGKITLRDAVALALLKNAELAAYSYEIRAREAAALQAGLLPNPFIETQIEDVNRSNQRAFTPSQSTIFLSQLLELGGKRAARQKVAELTLDLANRDYEIKRMDVLTRTAKNYVELLGAQEQLKLAGNLQSLAEQAYAAVAGKVKAGKVPPVEETRAQVTLATQQIELARAQAELNMARKRLAVNWSAEEPHFLNAAGDLFALPAAIPPLETLRERLALNPDLTRWAAEIARGQAAVEKEKTLAIPNLTVSGGLRHIDQTEDNTVVLGFSVPLQLFNRNQGAIAEAMHGLSRAESEQKAAAARAAAALNEAYQTLQLARNEVDMLQTRILPGAQAAFDTTQEGYRLGKFNLLYVLDSQQTLFQAKNRFIRALITLHKAAADVERLTGIPLAPLPPPAPEAAR